MRPPRVLPITPGVSSSGEARGLMEDIQRVKDGGGQGVLLREPQLSDRALLAVGRFAREVFCDGWLGIHDRVHVALACDADAAHLGFRSLSPSSARSAGRGKVEIGHSHHHGELHLQEMEADYRLIGPVHSTPSKEGVLEPIGLDSLSGIGMPKETWAVGGLGPAQVADVLAFGLAGVACIRGVFGVGDPAVGIADMMEAVRS